jgi:hypothetical protein
MLIDPADEDPRVHIRYNGDAPYGLTARGQATINRLNLRRGDLLERRQALLSVLTNLRSVAAVMPNAPEAREAKAHMQLLAASSEEFSAMVVDFLAAPLVPASTTVSVRLHPAGGL